MRPSNAFLVSCGASVLLAAGVPAQKKLGAEMDTLVSRYEPFGFKGAVLVARGGDPILARGYGLADVESGRRNDERTLFEIASISKSFTAAAILKLRDMGKLSTDDGIATHLPGVPEHSKAITIHQLLTHTSGVPGNNTNGRGDLLERAVADYLGEGPVREPGERWDYWNGGYALLAGIVERASGASFMEFSRDHLFEPAGMADTGFTGCSWLNGERAAIGTSGRGPSRSALDHPYGSFGYQYRGMGGVVTTVLDLLKWDRALAAGTVLSEAARADLFRPAVKARGTEYAYGWFVWDRPEVGRRQQHGGSVRGFMSDFRRLPDQDACIAILCNGESYVVPYIAENLELLLIGKPPRYEPPPEVVSAVPDRLAAYAATFSADGDRKLVIEVDGDRLRLEPRGKASLAELLGRKRLGTGDSITLRAVGNDEFVYWDPWGSRRFQFVVAQSEFSILRVGDATYVR